MQSPPPVDGGGRDDASLTPQEIAILITIERTGTGLSMVAIALTLVTFVVLKKLQTTPNLFLVFASVANAGASVASMMSYDGLRRGESSALCQAQAFIFEWCVSGRSTEEGGGGGARQR